MTSSPDTAELPRRGVILCVDHGQKRIGLAVTDVDQTMALPLTTIVSKSRAHDAVAFQQVVRDYRIVGCLIGLPLHMSGEESKQSAIVRKFGKWLHELTRLPVAYWDERLSSSQAEAVLWTLGEAPGAQNRGRLDGLAAQAILQAYLRSREPAPPSN